MNRKRKTTKPIKTIFFLNSENSFLEGKKCVYKQVGERGREVKKDVYCGREKKKYKRKKKGGGKKTLICWFWFVFAFLLLSGRLASKEEESGSEDLEFTTTDETSSGFFKNISSSN